MFRTITIGDLHGRPIWKKIIARKNEFDKIIFIADYFDSMDYKQNNIIIRKAYTNEEILSNILEIIFFKKENPDLVELLTGNHDASYFYFPKFFCQGFRADAVHGIQALFHEHRRLFNVAYQYKNYLWTHAGVTNKWLAEFKPLAEERKLWDDSLPLADILNMANETSLQEKLFQTSGMRMHPRCEYPVGGIIWADKSETRRDAVSGLHQIVGHTPVERNLTIFNTANNSSMAYIDSLATEVGDFYELNIE